MILVKKDTQSFKKEGIKNLSELRILKKNLVHVQGFPKSIGKIDTLKSKEYFGLYGNIIKIIMTYKINPSINIKEYSVYITYSNEKEAAYAILCVDSLLIQGKIIRAFFGTTKYCNYFINNKVCPILDKCKFLHQLVNDKDIILDDNMIFTYNDHINIAKKIINYSDPKTKAQILEMPKPKKIIFPFFDFIYLSEEEKENYFTSGIISYFNTNSKLSKANLFDNHDESKTESKSINNYINITNNNFQVNNIIVNISDKSKLNPIFFNNDNININNNDKNIFLNKININMSNNSDNSFETNEFHNLIDNSIKHILTVKPFYSNIKNFPLKKLELEFFKTSLEKNSHNFYVLFEGCLDCINDII